MSLNATIQETSNFQSLCFGKGNEFSFVLENNSIGVYKETEQLWKTKVHVWTENVSSINQAL